MWCFWNIVNVFQSTLSSMYFWYLILLTFSATSALTTQRLSFSTSWWLLNKQDSEVSWINMYQYAHCASNRSLPSRLFLVRLSQTDCTRSFTISSTSVKRVEKNSLAQKYLLVILSELNVGHITHKSYRATQICTYHSKYVMKYALKIMKYIYMR